MPKYASTRSTSYAKIVSVNPPQLGIKLHMVICVYLQPEYHAIFATSVGLHEISNHESESNGLDECYSLFKEEMERN